MENSTYVSRRLLHLLFFVLLGVSSQAQQIAKGLTAGNGKYIGFYEYKPTDYKPSGEKYPLIIFLHGVSERGNGTTELSKVLAQAIPRYINKGHKMTFTWNGKKETFLVLSPQLSLSYGNWQQFYTEEMLKYAKENLNIDTNRIYLTGISLGGGGVWNYASASEANSRKFAAIAPICGTCSMSNGCNIAKANVPVWTEHAANDPTVSVNCTINANKAINACTPGVKPIEFIPPTGGHVIWNRSYDTAYAYHQPLIYEWFLGQNKSLPINKLPVAKATAPLEVNISTGTFTLSATGSTDADGTIVRYGWRQISGPVTTSVQSAGSASSNVTGLTTAGTYTYELTVIDNRATWDKDTITVKGVSGPVIVPNKAPTANAGADQTITLPTNSVTLNGGASTDADGTITTWAWTKISGPASGTFSNSSAASTNFTGLTEGTYAIQLKITDNDGAADLDTIKVIVNPAPNKAPTATAGADQTIILPTNSVTLNGGASTDADGTITTWAWTKISGPASGTFSNAAAASTSFTGLTEGTYAIQLKITDNDGAADLDTINVIVNPAPNKAPTANAGADQTITLPANSVTLNGGASTDADGTITTWAWTKISGPAAGTFSNAAAASTSFTGLTEGTYAIQLKITDNDGATDLDTINVIVNPAPNKAPTANAGADQTITLPSNSVTLNGGASTDTDGTIATWAWTKISGPASGTFSNAGAASTNFTGLTEGTYAIQLKIIDNDGAADLDTINVIVNPAPNKAPTANAGVDQTITLPTNSVTLNGGASTDADGTITTWAWTKISGPASGAFSNSGAASTSFTGLTEGTYEVELRITDNDGASDLDTINVIVKPEPIIIIPNKAPTANAGADQTITLPSNSVTLNGGASTDADGTITTWAWTKISGPANGTFSKQNGVSTSFTGLTEGTYEVELRITDNDGASGIDTINVIVKPEPIIIIPNKAPTANAGADQTITLPTNSVTLNGGASTDADGTITTWAWTKIKGPANGTFSKQNGVSTTFTGLTEGTYEVELRITDNDGATDLDTINVIVKPEPIIIIPNKAPTANAGVDQTITLPNNSVTMNGGASTDADGTITTWAWTKISGPASGTFSKQNGVSTSFTGLSEGTYEVELRITDNDGATDLDTINVIVKPEPIIIIPNKAPTANAGADQTITLPTNSATLNGGASTDADGTITTWAWTKISGPASGTFSKQNGVSTSFSGLTEGTYEVELRITDNDGASDLDTINVIVKPEPIIIIPNKAPNANAGADQTITLPANSVTLNGGASTDVDGTITTWAWTKISGPASGTFSKQNGVSTSFTGLTEGTYSIQLKITDNDGASDLDTMKIIVKPAPNKAPIANAGSDKTILTTTVSVQLDAGLSTDPDGSISSYNWTRINGTGTMTMTTPNAVTATVYGLSEGIHVFRLTIKDNLGAQATDDVIITVKQPENQKPIAQAGQDITIYVPESKAMLDGKASMDPDGMIVRYSWKQLSGPRTAIQSTPASVVNEVSELAPGSYSFELTVTDNRNGVSSDTLNLTVINNFRYEEKLVASPNPAINTFKLTIYSDSNGAGIITIRDAFGRIMKQIKRDKSQPIEEENIYINDLKSGLYYLDYTIEKSKRMVTRFIKH